MKYFTLGQGALLVCLICPWSMAAEVNLQWQKPSEYLGIEAGNETSQQRFEEQVIEELGEHITEAADTHLPETYSLNMTVTDIDLAGDVEYFFTKFSQGVRVVRNPYFPSIAFEYEVLDEQGQVVERGSENIRDMGWHYSGARQVNDAPLDYEKELVDAWFRETFASLSPSQ